MTTTLDASNLRLKDVQSLLKLTEQLNDSFTSLLSLENLTEFEQQELQVIRNIFREYYSEGKISEGQIKFLFLAPLMKLAGFYHSSIKITLEENIANISVEDEDTNIKGRMDILAVSKTQERI
ncbi:MAG: restriction endonuclease subunit R, partial [Nostoc sp.]